MVLDQQDDLNTTGMNAEAGRISYVVAQADAPEELATCGGNEKLPQVVCVCPPWLATMGGILVYRLRETLPRSLQVCRQGMSLLLMVPEVLCSRDHNCDVRSRNGTWDDRNPGICVLSGNGNCLVCC